MSAAARSGSGSSPDRTSLPMAVPRNVLALEHMDDPERRLIAIRDHCNAFGLG